MITFLLSALCFLVSWRLTICLLHRAKQLSLVQAPTQHSSHVQPMPSGGGLGIVIASSVAGVWLA